MLECWDEDKYWNAGMLECWDEDKYWEIKFREKGMKYTRFEELPCWQKARELCQVVYRLINKQTFSRDFSLKDQIWRAAGSTMDNTAEGFDDQAEKEFIKFLGYSLRSCSEVQPQLYRALDCGHINQEEFEITYALAGDCRSQIKAFRGYLRKRKL